MKHRRNRWIALFLLPLFLAGCIRTTPLSQRAMVQAVGIDRKDGDGEFLLTVELLQEDEENPQNTVVTGQGLTLQQAFENASRRAGKEIFLGDNRLILFGEQTAKEGLAPIISYFNSAYQSRPRVAVAVSQGEAASIFQQDPESGQIPADTLFQLLDTRRRDASLPYSDLLSVMRLTAETNGNAYAPTFQLDSEGQLELTGTAVFQEERLIDRLSLSETVGILLANGWAERTPVTLEDPQLGTISMRIYHTDVHISSVLENDLPRFLLQLSLEAEILELLGPGNQNPLESLEQMENLLEEDITGKVVQAIERLVYRDGVDLLDLGLILKKYHPDWWRAHEEDWDSLLRKASFSIDVQSSINRIPSGGK